MAGRRIGYWLPMRLGVLDIGSNSAQLQVVDIRAGAPPLPAQAIKASTGLTEETDPSGNISAKGMESVVEATVQAAREAARQRVDVLYPYVTSSVRDAPNRDEVIDRIEIAAGLRPQFLSGEDEASLTYLAARRWYGWSAGRLLLLDIGGGSMEIALGRDAEPDLAVSLPLGAGRLTREFLTADPPRRQEVKQLRRRVRDTLGEVSDRLRWEGDPRRVVAASKTFKQLARLAGAAAQRKGPFARRHLSRDDLRDRIPRLVRRPAKERARLRGISAARAGHILAGAVVAHTTMTALNVDSVEICPWGLREGIMLRHLEAIADRCRLPLQPVEHDDGTRPTGQIVTPLHG